MLKNPGLLRIGYRCALIYSTRNLPHGRCINQRRNSVLRCRTMSRQAARAKAGAHFSPNPTNAINSASAEGQHQELHGAARNDRTDDLSLTKEPEQPGLFCRDLGSLRDCAQWMAGGCGLPGPTSRLVGDEPSREDRSLLPSIGRSRDGDEISAKKTWLLRFLGKGEIMGSIIPSSTMKFLMLSSGGRGVDGVGWIW